MHRKYALASMKQCLKHRKFVLSIAAIAGIGVPSQASQAVFIDFHCPEICGYPACQLFMDPKVFVPVWDAGRRVVVRI